MGWKSRKTRKSRKAEKQRGKKNRKAKEEKSREAKKQKGRKTQKSRPAGKSREKQGKAEKQRSWEPEFKKTTRKKITFLSLNPQRNRLQAPQRPSFYPGFFSIRAQVTAGPRLSTKLSHYIRVISKYYTA